jgi:hypothetical protein
MGITDVRVIEASWRQLEEDNFAEFLFGLEAKYAYNQGIVLVCSF